MAFDRVIDISWGKILHGVAQRGEIDRVFHPWNGSLWLSWTISIHFARIGAWGVEITDPQGDALGFMN
jgi:hypothetical protein